MAGFTLHSDQFNGQVPLDNAFNGMDVGGNNDSPDLRWTNPPAGTKSFLIFLHDPDAPTPAGFTHWCVFNVPAEVDHLPQGASGKNMPEGSVEIINSYGMQGYGGAAPPPGDAPHAYHLTIYALDTEKLDLDENASPPKVVFFAREHILAKAGLTAFFAR